MTAQENSQIAFSARRDNHLCVIAVVAGAYALLQLLSNIASLKVGVVLSLAVDMGTFCYPFTFVLRDIAHKVLGKRAVTALVIAASAFCLLAAGYLAWCAQVPGVNAGTVPPGGKDAFAEIFTPMWRLIVASIIAMLISELVDTQIYHRMRENPRQWLRVLVSNAFSIPLDNLIFAVGAFGGVLPWRQVGEIFLFNLLVKALVGALGTPLIYLFPAREKTAD